MFTGPENGHKDVNSHEQPFVHANFLIFMLWLNGNFDWVHLCYRSYQILYLDFKLMCNNSNHFKVYICLLPPRRQILTRSEFSRTSIVDFSSSTLRSPALSLRKISRLGISYSLFRTCVILMGDLVKAGSTRW